MKKNVKSGRKSKFAGDKNHLRPTADLNTSYDDLFSKQRVERRQAQSILEAIQDCDLSNRDQVISSTEHCKWTVGELLALAKILSRVAEKQGDAPRSSDVLPISILSWIRSKVYIFLESAMRLFSRNEAGKNHFLTRGLQTDILNFIGQFQPLDKTDMVTQNLSEINSQILSAHASGKRKISYMYNASRRVPTEGERAEIFRRLRRAGYCIGLSKNYPFGINISW